MSKLNEIYKIRLQIVKLRGRLSELRANPNHDPKNGRFTSGKGLTNSAQSGTLKSSQKPIGKNGRTLKAEDMPEIELDDGTFGHADKGTTVTKIYTFAGKGSKNKLRVEGGLVKQFGGTEGQWQHTTGDVIITTKGVTRIAEVHWFQEASVGIVKPKMKRWR